MKMNRFPAVLLAAALLVATACKPTNNKADQLAALDNAYQAGLLTKDEYDAKKRALTGPAAEPARESAPAPTPASAPSASPAAAPLQKKATHPLVRPAPPRRASALPATPPTAVSAAPAAAPVTSPAPSSSADAHEAEPAPLAGCEDAEYKTGGQKGAEERFFAASPEMVRRAAVAALDSLDFNIHKNTNKEIEASKKRHMGAIVGAGGERVILTFKETEEGGQNGTRVVGETKKNFIGHVSQRTWTDAVLAQIACKLRVSSR
jgi:hypothetical protein